MLILALGRDGGAGLPGFSTSVPWVAPGGAGWSGGRGGWPGRSGEESGPGRLGRPVSGEVQDQPAAGGRDPAGDVDDPGPQGRPADPGQAGGDGGGPGQVERDHCGRDPGGVRGVAARREVRPRAGFEFGDDLLDDRVFPVPLISDDGGQRGVGDEGVVPVGGEQLLLDRPVTADGLLAADPAHDQPAGDVLTNLSLSIAE